MSVAPSETKTKRGRSAPHAETRTFQLRRLEAEKRSYKQWCLDELERYRREREHRADERAKPLVAAIEFERRAALATRQTDDILNAEIHAQGADVLQTAIKRFNAQTAADAAWELEREAELKRAIAPIRKGFPGVMPSPPPEGASGHLDAIRSRMSVTDTMGRSTRSGRSKSPSNLMQHESVTMRQQHMDFTQSLLKSRITQRIAYKTSLSMTTVTDDRAELALRRVGRGLTFSFEPRTAKGYSASMPRATSPSTPMRRTKPTVPQYGQGGGGTETSSPERLELLRFLLGQGVPSKD